MEKVMHMLSVTSWNKRFLAKLNVFEYEADVNTNFS